jgi:hypothetical protein
MVISWVAQSVNVEYVSYNSSEGNQSKSAENLFH